MREPPSDFDPEGAPRSEAPTVPPGRARAGEGPRGPPDAALVHRGHLGGDHPGARGGARCWVSRWWCFGTARGARGRCSTAARTATCRSPTAPWWRARWSARTTVGASTRAAIASTSPASTAPSATPAPRDATAFPTAEHDGFVWVCPHPRRHARAAAVPLSPPRRARLRHPCTRWWRPPGASTPRRKTPSTCRTRPSCTAGCFARRAAGFGLRPSCVGRGTP
jgi:hypothetical protein